MRIDHEKVRQMRLERAWSQRELAELAGISELTLLKIEQGARPRPHPATTRGIAQALQVEPREIMKK